MKKSWKPLGHALWFKLVLTVLFFLPAVSEASYSPEMTGDVIVAVLSNPLAVSVSTLLPVAKLLLLAAAIIPFIRMKNAAAIFFGYYAFILLVVGFLQNMAWTESYGFVWIVGNTLIQLVVTGYCIYELVKGKSTFNVHLNKGRLWVIVPALLAFLMPYSINSGIIKPNLTTEIFYNEAGVTYCMITPVILGVMLVFSQGMHKPLFSVISYVGFIFGLLNMVTWFALQSQNWWMGVIHLPLLILSFYGLVLSRRTRPASVVPCSLS